MHRGLDVKYYDLIEKNYPREVLKQGRLRKAHSARVYAPFAACGGTKPIP